ncbi:hypothetical protein RND81_02G030800 [Saponaria officinalis]|uniref:BHLH domain-containing protein n=1 Tax=Saponaria officinalis TaxID=3572 RepID=A0AAW1MPF8_SAPOF
MSNRRSRSRQLVGVNNGIRDDEIQDLVSKLQQLLPQLQTTPSSNKVSATRVLQEACNYIRSLHREVDGLSERLCELLQTTTNDDTSQEAVLIIRTLLMQSTNLNR